MESYLPIVVMMILGVLFALLSFVASIMLGPKKPTAAKLAPYECGIVSDLEPAERFGVKFYLVAMIFIVFDIEIVFLYPFAVVFRQLRVFGLIEMGLFVLALVIAYGYLLSSGALDWGPARAARTRVERGVLRASGMSGFTPRGADAAPSSDEKSTEAA